MELSGSEKRPETSQRRYQARRKSPIRKCEACRISKQKCEPSRRDWSKGEKCVRCHDRGGNCSEPAIAVRKKRKTAHPPPTNHLSRRASDAVSSLAIPEEELAAFRAPIPGNQLLSPRTRSRTSVPNNSFSDRNETAFPLLHSEEQRLPFKPRTVVNIPTFQDLKSLDGSAKTANHSAEVYLILESSRRACDAIGLKGQLECDVESTREQIEHMSFALERRLFDIPKHPSRRYSASEAHERLTMSQDETMNSICMTSHLFGFFDPSVFKSHSLEEQQAIFLRKKIKECCLYGLYGWVCILLRKLCSLPHGQMTKCEHDLLAESYIKTSSQMKPFLLGDNIYPDEERISPSDEPFPALHRAILDEQIEAVKALINSPNYATTQPDILKRQPIHIAASCSSPEILQCIIDKCRRDDLNCRDLFLRTPLAYAAQSGNLENFTLLHKAGARLDNRDNFSHSILATAAGSGKIEIVRYMLDERVDPSDNGIAMGALHKAVENGHIDVVRLLLERGAKDRPLKNGQTARDIALVRNFCDIARVIEQNLVAQPGSDIGSIRTPNLYEMSPWEHSMQMSVGPSDLGNTYETGAAHRNFSQPVLNPSIAAAGRSSGQLLARNSLGHHLSWTNHQLDRQQLPIHDGNSTNAPSLGYAQIPFNASMSHQTPISTQTLPPTAPPTHGSTASVDCDTGSMQWYPSSSMDPYRFRRFTPFDQQTQ